MNRSLAVVCDKLHITKLESVLHESIGGLSIEQWGNLKNSEFIEYQKQLSISQKQCLASYIFELVEAIS